MKKVLLVGEHPLGHAGNSHMMRAIISQIDTEQYEFACFASIELSPQDYDIFKATPFPIIPAAHKEDAWGGEKLLSTIESSDFDILLFVGIDIWRYAFYFPKIKELKERKGFKWAALFPYDLQTVREDWVNWINHLDYPYVYSEHGEALLKNAVPNIKYFRPALDRSNILEQYPKKKRAELRAKYFPSLDENQFVYGFIGNNQFRKDPQKVIAAFEIVKKELPDTVLYFHTELDGGVYNLKQTLKDKHLSTGDALAKRPGRSFSPLKMVELMNSLDALVNCSLQEGLSWTLVEAMLCGVPVIATDTTAQTELVEGIGLLVPCEETASLVLMSESGQTWMEAKQCKAEDLAEAMVEIVKNEELRSECIENGLLKGKVWVEGVDDINQVFEEALKERIVPNIDKTTAPAKPVTKKKGVLLFAQHSAAGDVLMTTRCLKGLKERHGGIPIVYMTSPQYMDILRGNPYIDFLLPWDSKAFENYEIAYNPHGTRIAPGHWGRNCNSILSDFYWKILMVDPDDFFIEKKKPSEEVLEGDLEGVELPICVVHTTGGDSHFRMYKYMGDICEALKERYFTVQLGGAQDFPGWAEMDLRGKLSFRESAWVLDKASLSINVDSFISHLTGALGVSQVTLFGSGNAVVTRPNQMKGQLICLSPDYIHACPGLGPCSASVRDCPAPCTGKHDPKTILEAIKEIEDNGMVRRNTEHETSDYSLKFAT